jgi:hypothetical protein
MFKNAIENFKIQNYMKLAEEKSICKVFAVTKSKYFRKHATKVYDISAEDVKHINISWIGIKMEIRVRIRISIKTMPIHNAG